MASGHWSRSSGKVGAAGDCARSALISGAGVHVHRGGQVRGAEVQGALTLQLASASESRRARATIHVLLTHAHVHVAVRKKLKKNWINKSRRGKS